MIALLVLWPALARLGPAHLAAFGLFWWRGSFGEQAERAADAIAVEKGPGVLDGLV